MNSFKAGDLVWIVPGTGVDAIIRDNDLATKGVIMRVIPANWYRVHMSWDNKTRTVDFPAHMLKKIELDEGC